VSGGLRKVKDGENGMSHPTIQQLFALAQNQLSAGEAEDVERHLRSECQACARQLHDLQEMLHATHTRGAFRPPDWLVDQARNLFQWHTSRPADGHPRRLPAFLVIDSLAEGALLGFRHVNSMNKQMLYRAGGYDIDLFITYGEPDCLIDLVGQVMPLNTDLSPVVGAEVKLLEGTTITSRTQTNEFGEFIFNGLSEGFYDLRLELKDEIIDIIQLSTAIQVH
jgi:hypothetical protein